MPAIFVTNAALSIIAAVATGKTITGTGVITVSDAISSSQAFGGLPNGTVFNAGGVASATAMPAIFVTNSALSIIAAVATDKTITGSGVVTVSNAISSSQAFGSLPSGTVFALGGIASETAMPSSFVTNAALSIIAAVATDKTITGTGVVTVSDAISSSQAFGGLPNGTVFNAGGVASATAMPAIFVTNAALSIIAAVATGKTITGTGVVTVSNAISSSQAFGSLPSGTVFNAGGVTPASMPATFVNNASLTIDADVLSGKIVSGTGSITLNSAVANGQTFAGLTGSGQNYSITFVGGVTPASMPATFVNNNSLLTIDAAVLSGKTVSGTGPITLNSVVADGQTFDGLTGSGTITFVGGVTPASMPAIFVNNALLTIDADVLSGKTVSGTGPITLNSTVADGETFAGITSSGTITFVGGVTPASMPASFVNNASLRIAASVLSGKTVTGAGPIILTTAVADGETFDGLTGSGQYYSITFVGGDTPASMPASFVNNASLRIAASVLSGKTVSGLGPIILTTAVADGQTFAGVTSSGTITFVGGDTPASMPAT
jgi:hypothetical protein